MLARPRIKGGASDKGQEARIGSIGGDTPYARFPTIGRLGCKVPSVWL